MTFAVLSDSHLHNWRQFASTNENGINSRLVHILKEFRRCAHTLRQHKPDGDAVIYHAGDLFHVRGNVPPSVLNPTLQAISDIVDEYGVELWLLPGNHDMEMNSDLSVGYAINSLSSIKGVNVTSDIAFDDRNKVLMHRWHDRLDDLRRKVISSAASFDSPEDVTLIIHAPLNGVIKGIPDYGLSADEVSGWGFRRVYIGHYHNHRHFDCGRVVSVGATTHQTFSDIDTRAGFIIDGDSGFSFFESIAPKFVDIGSDLAPSEFEKKCKDNFVRVRLGESSPAEIAEIRERIISLGARGVSIEAQPARKSVKRENAGVTKAMTIRESVMSFIDGGFCEEDGIDDIKKASLAILDKAESVA